MRLFAAWSKPGAAVHSATAKEDTHSLAAVCAITLNVRSGKEHMDTERIVGADHWLVHQVGIPFACLSAAAAALLRSFSYVVMPPCQEHDPGNVFLGGIPCERPVLLTCLLACDSDCHAYTAASVDVMLQPKRLRQTGG